jgi:hypothetical protein
MINLATCLFLVIAGACSSHGSAPDNGSNAAAPAAAKGPARDACSLITDAEAAAALGGPAQHVDKGSRNASNGNGVDVTEGRCTYDRVTGDGTGHGFYVAVYNQADREYFNETGTKVDNEPIAGLGDAAKGSRDHVYVFAKGTMLQIYGSLAADTGMVEIARLAIAKL